MKSLDFTRFFLISKHDYVPQQRSLSSHSSQMRFALHGFLRALIYLQRRSQTRITADNTVSRGWFAAQRPFGPTRSLSPPLLFPSIGLARRGEQTDPRRRRSERSNTPAISAFEQRKKERNSITYKLVAGCDRALQTNFRFPLVGLFVLYDTFSCGDRSTNRQWRKTMCSNARQDEHVCRPSSLTAERARERETFLRA